MATGLLPNSFHLSQMASHYGYLGQAVQGPPSPPLDDAVKCSLPSISNLLDLADQGSPTSETYQHFQQQQPPSEFPFHAQSSRPSTRPSSSHFSANPTHRGVTALPPTPPMSSEASFATHESPSTKPVDQLPTVSPMSSSSSTALSSAASSSSVLAATKPGNYYLEATPPPSLEPADHRPHHQHRHSSQSSLPPYATLQPPQSQPQTKQQRLPTISYGGSSSVAAPPSYTVNQPTASAMPASYYPSMQQSTPPPQPQISALYYQRPLPQTFAPLPMTVQPSPWQHHHYISPSAAAAFPQSQDRYICPTCSKAFSRPSSLRIHSHSHTGEKPFKCPHAGCGKAFSVRSNMKRHERGCHNYDGSH